MDMNWEAIGALAEAFGAAGVIATLAFLAIQIRQSKKAVDANTASLDQNRKLAEAQAYEKRTQMILDYLLETRESDHIADVMGIDLPNGQLRNITNLRWWCNYLDNLHYQHERGFLDPDYYRTQYERVVGAIAPQWRAAGIRESRSAFKADVDRILQEGAGEGISG
jgi:hypothetical protein